MSLDSLVIPFRDRAAVDAASRAFAILAGFNSVVPTDVCTKCGCLAAKHDPKEPGVGHHYVPAVSRGRPRACLLGGSECSGLKADEANIGLIVESAMIALCRT